MRIRGIAPWYGAKRNLAKTIIKALGKHRTYWEPFCGSMAVLLQKPACRQETVNDLHGDLVNLARVIQDDTLGPRLYRRLRRTLACEELFREHARIIANGPPPEGESSIDRAYSYFVVSWLGMQGIAGTRSPSRTFGTSYCRDTAAQRMEAAVGSITQWRRRIRGVTILSRDAMEILKKIRDSDGTAIYVDPPYILHSGTYRHDFGAEDHQRLARLLQRFGRARVLVSYFDHPDLRRLYPHSLWSRRKIERSKGLASTGRRGVNSARATEVLLYNRRRRS